MANDMIRVRISGGPEVWKLVVTDIDTGKMLPVTRLRFEFDAERIREKLQVTVALFVDEFDVEAVANWPRALQTLRELGYTIPGTEPTDGPQTAPESEGGPRGAGGHLRAVQPASEQYEASGDDAAVTDRRVREALADLYSRIVSNPVQLGEEVTTQSGGRTWVFRPFHSPCEYQAGQMVCTLSAPHPGAAHDMIDPFTTARLNDDWKGPGYDVLTNEPLPIEADMPAVPRRGHGSAMWQEQVDDDESGYDGPPAKPEDKADDNGCD